MREHKGTIIYVGGFEMPDRNAAAHRVLNNAYILKKLGYNVCFCGIDKTINKTKKYAENMLDFQNWPSNYPLNYKQWIFQMLDFSHIKNVLRNYKDVKYVIAYNMHVVPLFRLIQYCKKNNIKVYADITEWYENKFSLNPIKFIRFLDTEIVMKKLQKKVDGMLVISSMLKDYYKKSVSKIIVVPPLVNLDEEKWHNHKDINMSKVIKFVYSGIPGTDKDKIGLIIEAFSKIKVNQKYLFNIVGISKKQFIEMYPQYLSSLEIVGEKVNFLGKVSHEDSIKYLLESDYCIFVRDKSRKNMAGFPTKFVECMTSNIRIIANNISDIEIYFPHDKYSILLDDCNIDGLVYSLEQVFCISIDELRKTRNQELCSCFDYRNWVQIFCELFE